MAVHVRPANATDVAAITAVLAHAVATSTAHLGTVAPHPDDVAADLREATLPWLVAVVDDRVAGFARAAAWKPREGYRHTCEDSVYVAADARGQGVGNALLAGLLAALRTQDLRTVLAGITQPNPASVALHERHGFVHVGTLPAVGRKFDHWVDVGYWALDLGTSGMTA